MPFGTFAFLAQFFARRIRSYVPTGVTVLSGKEVGFIRLGSRAHVFLPRASMVLVRVGQQVHASETVLGRLSAERPG